jgi:hypothetical protein
MANVGALLLEPHTNADFTCGFGPHYYAAETSARFCYTIISFGPTTVNGTCVSSCKSSCDATQRAISTRALGSSVIVVPSSNQRRIASFSIVRTSTTMEAGEPAHEHATLDLSNARKRRTVNFDHRFSPGGRQWRRRTAA